MSFIDIILKVVPNSKIISVGKSDYNNIKVDSRSIQSGDLFLPLIGEKSDGHDYIDQAISNGATVLIVNDNKKHLSPTDRLVISVPDTFKALDLAARHVRNNYKGTVVGITGSVGKTTTKEMLRLILESRGGYVSPGNQNSIVGLRLSLLGLLPEYKFAALEMGISEPGDIEDKVSVGKPDIAVITKIAHLHVQGLGGLRKIAEEKAKIFSSFSDDNVGIIPGDQEGLFKPFSFKTVKFGLKEQSDFRAINIHGTNFILVKGDQRVNVSLACENPSFIENALAAASVASCLGLSLDDIAEGLARFKSAERRFQRKKICLGFGELIDDTYNAGPESMKASIEAFKNLAVPNNNKIMVLGDMLELGERAGYWHRQLVKYINNSFVDHLVLVGEEMSKLRGLLTCSVIYAKTWKEARVEVEKLLKPNTFMLVKASRGIGLNNLVDSLAE